MTPGARVVARRALDYGAGGRVRAGGRGTVADVCGREAYVTWDALHPFCQWPVHVDDVAQERPRHAEAKIRGHL